MRPDRDRYMMMMARTVRSRSTCRREGMPHGVGCVISSPDGHVLCTGYNGSPPGEPHCDDAGHVRVDGRCVRTIHAEQNAVAQAAQRGVVLKGSTAYTTSHPCADCAKLLAAAGVIRVMYMDPYRSDADQMVRSLVPSVQFQHLVIRDRFMDCERPPGYLIVIEGIDGSGKSTLARSLADYHSALLVSEPGGTEFGDRVRASMTGLGARPCNVALTHAFIAARAQLLNDVVGPALMSDRTVVMDRSFISSMAYQGRDGDEMAAILAANAHMLNLHRAWPAQIILLMLPARVAMDREKKIGDDPAGYDTDVLEKHEARASLYQEAVKIAADACGSRYAFIDANRDPSAVLHDAMLTCRRG